ncbi:MAG: DUF4670 domain-containing protein [Chloroflexales bacterium]|nr:DUF4670 domain-containing protein [Chloroflexales bacterium]
MTTVAELVVDVKASENVSSVLQRLEADLDSFYNRFGNRANQPLIPEIPPSVPRGLGQARDEALALAQAEARLERASGNTVGAINRLEAALAGQATRTRQVIQAETQLVTLKQQLARETGEATNAFQRLAGVATGFGKAFGALGITFSAQQIGQFALAAGRQANELEKTQALMRVAARDQATYNQLVQVATANQRAYGGTLQENLQALGRLAPLARNANLEFSDLNRATQLLALASPEQGLEGANSALRELIEGTGAESIQSLVEHFDLPQSALRALTDESLTAREKLEGLFTVLEQEGFGAAALNAQLDTTAATYDRLGASISNVIDAIGGAVAEGFEPAARGLDRLLQAALGDKTAQLELQAILNGTPTLDLNEALNEAQQRYASALIANGQSQEQAIEAALQNANSLALLQDAIDLANNATWAHSDALQALIPEMIALAAAGGDNVVILDKLLLHYRSTGDIDFLTAALGAATYQLDANTGAMDDNTAAIEANTRALVDETQRAFEAEHQAERLAKFQAELIFISDQVAKGHVAAGEAAAKLATKYNIAEDAALALIGSQATLARVEAARTEAQREAARAEAQRLERESREQIRTRTTRRSGGGRSRQLSDEQRRQNQILSERAKAQQRLEQAEQDHQERILAIQQRFAERQLDQERSNNLSKLQSRAAFYDALTTADAEGQISSEQAQALSAAYEAAFAESQRLAQEGNTQLAADFLDLRQKQIQEELDFQRRLAAARATAADPEADAAERTRAQEEVSRLQAIENLRRQARDEELKQLLEQGDELIAERDRQLAAETERFRDAQGDIMQASDFATERKIQNALRSGQAIEAETALLREQARVIQSIGPRTPAGPTPAPITTGGPGTGGGTNVLTVQDPVVAATISDGDARLEQIVATELGTVRAAVEAVERRVGAVEGAVRGLAGRLVN